MMKHVMMLATLGTLLVTGCATGTGGWEVSLFEGKGESIRFRVDDNDFAETLGVERTRIRRASSGLSVAEVDVRNADDDDFTFQYRFVFLDADGSPILPEARSWDQLVIHGGESRTLSATAPSQKAVGFRVRARRITKGE